MKLKTLAALAAAITLGFTLSACIGEDDDPAPTSNNNGNNSGSTTCGITVTSGGVTTKLCYINMPNNSCSGTYFQQYSGGGVTATYSPTCPSNPDVTYNYATGQIVTQ